MLVRSDCAVLRSAALPEVYTSIARAFRPPVDFFGVVALGDGDRDTAKGQWAASTRESLAPALQHLRPVAWNESQSRVHQALPLPACGLSCMRQFERLELCAAMVRAEEHACGQLYSWVVRY